MSVMVKIIIILIKEKELKNEFYFEHGFFKEQMLRKEQLAANTDEKHYNSSFVILCLN